MKSYTINNKQVSIPENWDECTFIQVLRMAMGPESERAVLTIFTGLSQDELRDSKDVDTYNKILIDISFLSTEPPKYGYKDKINFKGQNLRVPNNLLFETTGQFEDLKAIIKTMQNEDRSLEEYEVMQLYPMMLAIYLQPQLDGEYDYFKAEALSNEIYLLPCGEVIGVGTFFLAKWNEYSTGITRDVQREALIRRKKKLGFLLSWIPMEWLPRFLLSPVSTTKKETTY